MSTVTQDRRYTVAELLRRFSPYLMRCRGMLVLDEATSALDNESEIQIENSLAQLSQGRTTLTIAHRLTTVKDADRIIVLGRQGIEEESTHEELLKKKGTYWRLWNGVRETATAEAAG